MKTDLALRGSGGERVPEPWSGVAERSTPHGAETAKGNREVDLREWAGVEK